MRDSRSVRLPALLLVLVVFVLRTGPAKADKPVDFEHAIKVIETLEHRIKSVQWKAEYAWGYVDDVSTPRSFKYRDGPVVGVVKGTRVVFEPWTGRYRYDYELVAEWIEGKAPHIGERYSYAYDGETEQELRWSRHGTQLPGHTDPRGGEVKLGKGAGFVTKEGQWAGIGWFPPMFQHRLLSEGLREAHAKRPVKIAQDSSGLWHIETLFNYGSERCILRLRYDPGRGGVVTDATWHAEDGRAQVWQRYHYELQQVQPDIWVPKVVLMYCALPQNKERLGIRVVYTDVKVNEKLEADVFRIDFPAGTKVVDFTNRKSYTAGNTLDSEREQIKRFLQEEALWVAENPPTRRYLPYWIGGGVLLALVLGIVSYYALRKRRKAAQVGAILFVSGLAFTPALAQVEMDKNGNWFIHEKNGRPRRLSPCGINVTLFALECFKVEYTPKLVSAALPPNEDGVRLADIQAVLEAHGLDADSRQGVGVRGLIDGLRQGRIAIVPIKLTTKQNHYIIVHCDRQRGLLLIDPPHGVKPTDSAELAARLSEFNGLVLFVARSRQGASEQSASLSFMPEVTDLGEFDVSSPEAQEPLRKTIRISNTGQKAVIARQVLSSCGCIASVWEGGILPAGGNQSVEFELHRNRWGVGALERPVTLVLADGSRASIRFRGKGLVPEIAHDLRVSPELVRVQFTGKPSSGTQILERTASIERGEKARKISIASRTPWLKAELGQENEGAIPLRLQMQLQATMFADLQVLKGRVDVWSREDQPSVALEVVVQRPDSVQVTPFLSRVSKKGSQSSRVLVDSDGSESSGRLQAYTEPEGFEVTVDQEAGRLAAVLNPAASVRPGYYVLRFFVEHEGVKYRQGSSLIHVTD
jgi:uncharacterized protein DUF1573/peptidase C39-like protein